ncbi:hypothetical protein HOY80DRAFT_215119 [Tuber brumale]|nr:hypothetical protein HOY80DRAFT_215119 [Tuber brumale]
MIRVRKSKRKSMREVFQCTPSHACDADKFFMLEVGVVFRDGMGWDGMGWDVHRSITGSVVVFLPFFFFQGVGLVRFGFVGYSTRTRSHKVRAGAGVETIISQPYCPSARVMLRNKEARQEGRREGGREGRKGGRFTMDGPKHGLLGGGDAGLVLHNILHVWAGTRDRKEALGCRGKSFLGILAASTVRMKEFLN